MIKELYTSNFRRKSKECLQRAGNRCEGIQDNGERCNLEHRSVQSNKRGQPYILYLHAAHINQDPHNPEPELKALCPSCHMKLDRNGVTQRGHRHRRGYEVIGLNLLLYEMRSAGLEIERTEEGWKYRLGELEGIGAHPLDALVAAIEWTKGQQ